MSRVFGGGLGEVWERFGLGWGVRFGGYRENGSGGKRGGLTGWQTEGHREFKALAVATDMKPPGAYIF